MSVEIKKDYLEVRCAKKVKGSRPGEGDRSPRRVLERGHDLGTRREGVSGRGPGNVDTSRPNKTEKQRNTNEPRPNKQQKTPFFGIVRF